MSDADVLRAAKAKIADPEHWTTGEMARGKSGHRVAAKGRAACQWCALGALERMGGNRFAPLFGYLSRAAQSLHEAHPVEVNDGLGHEATLAMYDKAIEYAEADK